MTILSTLEWHQPLWLLLMMQPVIMFLLKCYRQRQPASRYAEKHLLPWVIRTEQANRTRLFYIKELLVFISWLLFSLAMAGPRTAQEYPSNVNQYGTDIMILLDVSRSMNANDIQPSRLLRAKLKLAQLNNRLRRGDRMGVIVFAARPHLLMPYSFDREATTYYLEQIKADWLPTLGTDLGAAIALAIENTSNSQNVSRKQALILLSDGDYDPESLLIEKIRQQLISNDIALHVIGVGTEEGTAISLANQQWLQHDGRAVITRLNEPLLDGIAQDSKGEYRRLSDDDSDLHAIYDNTIAKLSRSGSDEKQNESIIWKQYYAVFLLPAILVWFYQPLFSSKSTRRLNNNLPALLLIFGIFSLLISVDSRAETLLPEEKQHYEQATYQYRLHNYDESKSLYAQVSGYQARVGEALSAYHLQTYDQATSLFSQAIMLANNDEERASAVYNLAVCLFNQGDYGNAISRFEEADLYRLDFIEAKNALIIARELFAVVLQLKNTNNQAATRTQSGKGPRSTSTSSVTDLSEGRLSLGDDESIDDFDDIKTDYSLPNRLSQIQIKQLIDRGLAFIKLAEQENKEDTQNSFSTDYPSQISKMYTPAEFNSSFTTKTDGALWKRLFEIEEGIPAPEEEPQILPGIKPW